MTKNIVSVTAALVGAGALLTGCNFDQPTAGCIVQDSPSWIAKYELKEGQSIPEGCRAAPAGELLGVFKFANPQKEGESKLTLRPAGLASRASRDPGDPSLQTAVGDLAEEPDAQDFCAATDITPAAVNAAPSSSEAATSIIYQFENVKVYSAPQVPGTQLTGDLAYTRTYEGVTCTLEYSVRALWPAVPCDPNSDRPADSCGAGSGVNPDFAVVCDPEIRISSVPSLSGACVPATSIPSLKGEEG